MEKELIKLKGTIDGVKVYLDAESDFSDITASLYDKLRQFRNFFGDGHCNIYFVGRELGASDKMRLEAIVNAMLPEGAITYGDRKKTRSNDIETTLKLPDVTEETAEAKPEEDDTELREIKEVVTTNYKSSRARFYEGTVREDVTVESDGHLILVGDIESGGKVAAVGNVVIMGSVRGSVEAGCMGNDNAYIIAMEMRPSDIRIAKTHRKFTEEEFSDTLLPQKAYLINNQIFIDDFLLKR